MGYKGYFREQVIEYDYDKKHEKIDMGSNKKILVEVRFDDGWYVFGYNSSYLYAKGSNEKELKNWVLKNPKFDLYEY